MKVQLLVSKWCPTCPQAEHVWSEVAARRSIDYEVLDVGERAGREVVSNLRIKTVPAVVIDGRLQAVGAQPLGEALALVQSLGAAGE